MKKYVSIVLLFAMMFSFVSCSGINMSTLKLEDTQRCKDCSIKLSTSTDMSATYYITPEGFEWDKLEEKGYKMKITVTYDVYYKKDWGLGFGYAGSPKYEVSVFNSDGMGKIDANIPAEATPTTRTLSFSSKIVDLKDTRVVLTFSTDNIQNIIYFTNIRVDYQCYK